MGNLVRHALWWLFRLFVPLRYRIRVRGLEHLNGLSPPILLLPNHPGLIDPVLVLTTFYGRLRPRAVLFEGNFPEPIRSGLVWLLRAVAVPDLSRPTPEAHQRTQLAIDQIVEGLRRGDNFVLWPSGRAQRDGVERLGSARGLTDILREVPEATVVRLRTQGVWGSMFSMAPIGRLPNLGMCLLKGALLLLGNLLLFMPRRRVEMTLDVVCRTDLPELEWSQINPWFEAWYNSSGPEPPTFVPYHFLFGPRRFTFPTSTREHESELQPELIRPETRQGIATLLSEWIGRPLADHELHPEQPLDDLGLDSLRRMDLALAVQRQFGVAVESAPATVGELLLAAQGMAQSRPSPAPRGWLPAAVTGESPRILADTIPEAFVARAIRSPGRVAAADETSGIVTYERLLIGAWLLASRLRRLPGTNVGLLLPASVACDMLLMAFYFADKRPVLLNWTTGPSNLRHAARLTGLSHVVSSRRVRDRLKVSIEGVEFVDVEDLRDGISGWEKLFAWLSVRLFPGRLRRQIPHPDPDEPAVILFTSGSEKAPKAVPLTHRNVLSNQRGALEALEVTTDDSMLGFLPMFHSFGFTMTSLLPLLSGIRVVHYPDPTDTVGLARTVAAYHPTIFVGMPTFVENVLDRADPRDLQCLRLITVGAEKCPPSLFAKAAHVVPNAHLLEGYGVTECSPVISVNRPGANRVGSIGRPLPGVEVLLVDLETEEIQPPGKMGMLLVGGPGVFPGYLGEEKSPFVERDGKRWYVTGDLAELDDDGFLHFRGRLKRFLKAGGEMISLPALEEPFEQRFPRDRSGPHVAVEGIETDQGRTIVLFTTEALTLDEANAQLREAGLRGVMRLNDVRLVAEIPVLGTGKVDYKALRAMITPPALKQE